MDKASKKAKKRKSVKGGASPAGAQSGPGKRVRVESEVVPAPAVIAVSVSAVADDGASEVEVDQTNLAASSPDRPTILAISSDSAATVLNPSSYRFDTRKFAYTQSRNRLVVGLEPNETLCFVGSVEIRACEGSADTTVLGYRLPTHMYTRTNSPSWDSALVIQTEESARGGKSADAAAHSGTATAADDEEEREVAELAAALRAKNPSKSSAAGGSSKKGGKRAAAASASSLNSVVVFRTQPPTFSSFDCPHESAEQKEKAAADEARRRQQEAQPTRRRTRSMDEADPLHSDDDGSGSSASTSSSPSSSSAPRSDALSLPGFRVVLAAEPGVVPLHTSERWEQVAASSCSDDGSGLPPRVAICGAKGVGKSTMAKRLVHELLTKRGFPAVAYLDTDVGQPELGPPGLVSLSLLRADSADSLLGPAHANARLHCSLRTVTALHVPTGGAGAGAGAGDGSFKTPSPAGRAFFVGASNPAADPLRFSAAVRAAAASYFGQFSAFRYRRRRRRAGSSASASASAGASASAKKGAVGKKQARAAAAAAAAAAAEVEDPGAGAYFLAATAATPISPEGACAVQKADCDGGGGDDEWEEVEVAVPLVINTHGWVKGLGKELLMDVLEAVAPRDVLQVTN
jgi:hypothetical protein